jgi:ribosome-binding factor A
MDPHRAERLAASLRDELHDLIQFEVADPRLGPVHVTSVELSPDGRKAVVRVTAVGGQTDLDQSVAVLSRARGFLKESLARDLQLSRVPELYFEAAAKAGSDDRVEYLLRRARRGRPREEKSPTG